MFCENFFTKNVTHRDLQTLDLERIWKEFEFDGNLSVSLRKQFIVKILAMKSDRNVRTFPIIVSYEDLFSTRFFSEFSIDGKSPLEDE